MKITMFCLLFSILTAGCKHNGKNEEEVIPLERPGDNLLHENSTERSEAKTVAFLSITANALQVVNAATGSTTELPLGIEMNQLVEVLEKVLSTKMPEAQVNSECGAGPMTIIALENGLILMFQNSKRDKSRGMEFVGWSLRKGDAQTRKITTMAGIGIGSSRRELEEAYVVEINKTSLGNEFSIGGEMFGILNTSDEIEFMWSGLSCNFR